MLDLARKHVLGWTTSAALTLAAMRFVTPSMVDFIIDDLTLKMTGGAVVPPVSPRHIT